MITYIFKNKKIWFIKKMIIIKKIKQLFQFIKMIIMKNIKK